MPDGLCCDPNSPNAACTLAMKRKTIVKEYCLFNDNSGICKNPSDCTTMASPARGTCSEEFHVCCIIEAPDEVNSGLVEQYLANVVCTIISVQL